MSTVRSLAVTSTLVAALFGAGCTSDHQRTAPAPVVSGPAVVATTAAPPAPLKTPAKVKGELVRVTVSQQDLSHNTVVSGAPRAGHEYWVRAACTSSAPGDKLSYEVTSGKKGVIARGEVTCDGQPAVDGLGVLPAGAVSADLKGDEEKVTGAYAIVVPSP